jgi:hypothetical protein
LIIDNLAIAINWIAGIKISKIGIALSDILMQKNLPLTLQIKRIKIENISPKLRMNFVQVVSAGKILIREGSAQFISLLLEISSRTISILGEMRMVQKLGSVPIKLYKILMDAELEAAQFYFLSTYDPQTLSAMDTETLADLDYTAV